MTRRKSTILIEFFLIGILALLMLLSACRREAPTLDRNRDPQTYITSSPPETTDAEYRVHLYWHGTDRDGVVERYIWHISDTVMTLDPIGEPDIELLDWNPRARIADYLTGKITSKTDSIFIFQGFDNRTGAIVNKQAFHIASIDDGGKLDPSPARLQFLGRVNGVPTVEFWLIFYRDNGDSIVIPYDPCCIDTVPMFTPFAIKFTATTPNRNMAGYRWSYQGQLYPTDTLGVPYWEVEEDPVWVPLKNRLNEDALPDGAFYLMVTARDEAGALSRSNIVTGEGFCSVILNHDPLTWIMRGEYFYTPQSTGQPTSDTVNFHDDKPDTLPYNARLRMNYAGEDDWRDIPSLETKNPPDPLKFQFQFAREAQDGSAKKGTPWYPFKPEDTNPGADVEDPLRDADSTTMRVGPFSYKFYARSFDEQGRGDGTPAMVSFIGSYPPTIDSADVGFDDPDTPLQDFRSIKNDTLYIGWNTFPGQNRGDTLATFRIAVSPPYVTKYYRWAIRCGGHDHPKDPPGSAIKGWIFNLYAEDDYPYSGQGEWNFLNPPNELTQDMIVKLKVPIANAGDSIVNDPPAFFGDQVLVVIGGDIKDTEEFKEGIRGITPQFDSEGNVIPGWNWIENSYKLATYARRDTLVTRFYIKLVF